MACPAIRTGEQFLAASLAHIDCQAQTIGAYGFGALADPGSPVSLALGSLLAVFVALFGIRLLLGYPIGGRDVVTDVVKVGIVLTLATSWPAWRVLGYDLVIAGPQDLARAIGLAAQLPGSAGDLAARLQNADAGIAALNSYGSGRLGVATGDWFQLGFARSAFLTGTLGPLALVRLATGILLAIAPLMAGLLLFGITRPIFAGWLKGLVMVFLSSLGLTLLLGTELALLEPWLQDALAKRAADYQTLDAPVEILVTTLAFALVSFLLPLVMAFVAFHSESWIARAWNREPAAPKEPAVPLVGAPQIVANDQPPSRGQLVALSVGESLQREERIVEALRIGAGTRSAAATHSAPSGRSAADGAGTEILGSTYRRSSRRVSQAGKRRDQKA